MAMSRKKKKWIFKRIKARSDIGPIWLKPRKGKSVFYEMRYEEPGRDETEVYVFRNGHFSLPRGWAPDNPDLEHVALADSSDKLTGYYIDFLIEGSNERFQTIRSLLEEVLEGKNPRKPIKKKAKRKTAFKFKE